MSEKMVECELSSATPEDDEINLIDLWLIIWKRRMMIAIIVFLSVMLTIAASLSMTDIYQSKAVIAPVAPQGGSGGSASAFASVLSQQLGGLPGLMMPGSSSAQEIVSLLKSGILREKVVTTYDLIPVLFDDQWDPQKKDWIKERSWLDIPKKLPKYLLGAVRPARPGSLPPKEEGVPTMFQALRLLENDVITITDDSLKSGIITIAVEFKDPLTAQRIAQYIVTVLTEHMSAEAKRVAETNRKYLEEQLNKTADPMIKQNLYNLIAQQLQTSMMAEVKENFGFKVIDPPRLPEEKSRPKRTQMVVLSFFVSAFLAVFIVFFLEYFKKAKATLTERKKPEHMEKEEGIQH